MNIYGKVLDEFGEVLKSPNLIEAHVPINDFVFKDSIYAN